jgi:hypothetical protein
MIGEASTLIRMGDYRGALELVHPWTKKKLQPLEELGVVTAAGNCYRCLSDFKSSLRFALRRVALLASVAPRSLDYAVALKEVCEVQTGLKSFPAARKAILEALATVEALDSQQEEHYGEMLVALARVDRDQRRCKDALVVYEKAKVKEPQIWSVVANCDIPC